MDTFGSTPMANPLESIEDKEEKESNLDDENFYVYPGSSEEEPEAYN